MSSDDAYASFLDKANQDTGSGGASAQSSKKKGTKAVTAAVPKELEGIDEVYSSEADEPFEAVSLAWDGEGEEGPSADDLKSLLSHPNAVTAISQKDFDPGNQYGKVVDKVKKAGSGEVAYFEVELDESRTEYWVVGVVGGKGKERRVVGVKAVAVMT
ncbi:hypothetical protein K402DRAFT_322913 [Aulographum hederae CBS 113979]|uniref:Uncharacterized protein n=1 Tax=Aulographum hederae CBS 113979 TaxID=1176131 RepID=A0A6G1HEK3_9PEZI|nr:hypothetical protein K402DRAFT_322913 [Aulographum hederae CBS 113979]